MQGIDPARLGLQGMFGQQQPRTIQTTDPGAGYGMSPSGPTAQMPPTQLRPQGVNSAGQRVVSQFDPQINPLDHSVLPNLDSPSFSLAQQPQARPRQNVTEQFSVPANYGQSPSNPNWRAGPTRTPKPMSPFYEPPVPFRPPTGGP